MTREQIALVAAIDALRTDGGCWCDTGDGNPHTAACLQMQRALLAAVTGKDTTP